MEACFHASQVEENPCIGKSQGWEPIHKKYKANKNPKTHVTKANNNKDTTNALRKLKTTN
jgi:hypothetical protein